MASFPSLMRTLLLTLGVFTAAGTLASAQSFDERARTILQLFETGQKDSAYMLIEPLKKEARFVPSVLYTRAQMTPDDRALNLYREIIALEPGGGWADDAAYQLVRRYIDKRDSSAAHTWANVLRTNYPRSPFVTQSDESLKGVTAWIFTEDHDGPLLADRDGRSARTTKKIEEKPAETYKATAKNMRGFALQVGLFPTKAAAEKRATELGMKKLKAVALPKTVDGKKQYALVVGPYKTLDEAGKKKATVSTGCNCPAFVVKVE
jgi:hypothetical protein